MSNMNGKYSPYNKIGNAKSEFDFKRPFADFSMAFTANLTNQTNGIERKGFF